MEFDLNNWIEGSYPKIKFITRWFRKDRHLVREDLTREQILFMIPPSTCYCYDSRGNCPFWTLNEAFPKQMNGYCMLLERGDFIDHLGNGGTDLLWDQCKECGIGEGYYER